MFKPGSFAPSSNGWAKGLPQVQIWAALGICRFRDGSGMCSGGRRARASSRSCAAARSASAGHGSAFGRLVLQPANADRVFTDEIEIDSVGSVAHHAGPALVRPTGGGTAHSSDSHAHASQSRLGSNPGTHTPRTLSRGFAPCGSRISARAARNLVAPALSGLGAWRVEGLISGSCGRARLRLQR